MMGNLIKKIFLIRILPIVSRKLKQGVLPGITFSILYSLSNTSTSSTHSTSLCFIPNNWQTLIELIYETTAQLLYENINIGGKKYFPFVSAIFTFILFSNLIGLIPYSFTITSHLIVTFTLSFSIFIGVNIICIKKYKSHMLSLFRPVNTSFGLVLVLWVFFNSTFLDSNHPGYNVIVTGYAFIIIFFIIIFNEKRCHKAAILVEGVPNTAFSRSNNPNIWQVNPNNAEPDIVDEGVAESAGILARIEPAPVGAPIPALTDEDARIVGDLMDSAPALVDQYEGVNVFFHSPPAMVDGSFSQYWDNIVIHASPNTEFWVEFTGRQLFTDLSGMGCLNSRAIEYLLGCYQGSDCSRMYIRSHDTNLLRLVPVLRLLGRSVADYVQGNPGVESQFTQFLTYHLSQIMDYQVLPMYTHMYTHTHVMGNITGELYLISQAMPDIPWICPSV